MRRIGNFIQGVIFVIVFCFACSIAIPQLRDPFFAILYITWEAVKAFFLEDMVIKSILYIIIVAITTGTCFHLSKRKENKVWQIVGIVADIIGLLVFLV